VAKGSDACAPAVPVDRCCKYAVGRVCGGGKEVQRMTEVRLLSFGDRPLIGAWLISATVLAVGRIGDPRDSYCVGAPDRDSNNTPPRAAGRAR
jgi:hypothetical protein